MLRVVVTGRLDYFAGSKTNADYLITKAYLKKKKPTNLNEKNKTMLSLAPREGNGKVRKGSQPAAEVCAEAI